MNRELYNQLNLDVISDSLNSIAYEQKKANYLKAVELLNNTTKKTEDSTKFALNKIKNEFEYSLK